MRSSKRVLFVLYMAVILGISSIAGCSCIEDIREMDALSDDINETFDLGSPGIGLLNNEYLTVEFKNSDLGEITDPELEELARQIAEFVRDNYKDYARLKSVSIRFTDFNRYGPVTTWNTEALFNFETSDLN